MEFSKDELIDLINSFKSVVEEQDRKIDELKTFIQEEFLGPAEANYKAWDHSTRLSEFKDKYKDSLTDELCNKCKEIEADETFDLADKIFSDYDTIEGDKMPEEEYVASVVASLTEQIEGLKEKLNAEEVVIEATEDGKVEVEADGEPVAEAEVVSEEPVDSTETEPEEKKDEEFENEDAEDEDEEAFIKELESTKIDRSKHW